MNYSTLKMLYVTEQHLTLALKSLKEESYDDTRLILFTALSSVGQLQEILEQEAFDDFEERREGR
tara:strand:+ start:1011 stop:1205 length:195 start_codon:yes stop_codon:yes gene_type:complete